ncbi:MAG TPA: amino acid permease [Gemmatimonadales bacterium]|nr:amino acid permease [Gemmatimonadales bacterium]
MPSATYRRELGLFSATMSVVGGIIGTGIFLNPSHVAQRLPSAGWSLAAWATGGVIALLGAFIFAELGQRMPKVGGGYAYLREAFGPLPGFLYGWALLLIMATGAAAAVAMTFATYLQALTGYPPALVPAVAAAALVALSLLNIAGVRPAAWTLNVLTVLKLLALVTLIGAGLFLGGPERLAAVSYPAPATPSGPLYLLFANALVPILFSYGGWQQTNFVAEEIRDPEKTLPRALLLGVLIVVAVYVLANAAYLRTLGHAGLAASTAPASDTMALTLGGWGRTFITAGIVISTFGFLDLVILVSPRVYQAMAADGLFFRSFARISPRTGTPVTAIAFQGLWAVALLFTKTYGQLLDYVTFADWIFFGTTALTLLVLRRRPAAEGFRAPAAPLMVGLFVAAAAYVVVGSIANDRANALIGAGLLALGVPVYLFWRKRGGLAPGPTR